MFSANSLKKLIYGHLLLAITLVVSNCSISDVGIPLDTVEDTTELDFEYGEVIIQNEAPEVIIPVGISVESYNRWSSSSGFHSQSDLDNGNSLLATNLIFYNPKNNSTHLLLEQKAIISQFNYLQSSVLGAIVANKNRTESATDQKIIYNIIDRDTDGDGKLTRGDAEIAYLSDLSGKNLVPITPRKTKVLNWEFVPQTKIIVLSLQLDSDQDQKFTREDRVAGYIYNLVSSKLQLITPDYTNLLSWKIDNKHKLIWLKLRKFTNQAHQFNGDQGEINWMTIQLENIAVTNEILSNQIKEKIKEINLKN